MSSRILLLQMNTHLVDFHTNRHGETQVEKTERRKIALIRAEGVYLQLVELWAELNPHPAPRIFLLKEGRLMVRQSCKGTLSRYVLLENYNTFDSVYEPLTDYDRVLIREEALGLGEIKWKLDVIEGYDPLEDM